MLHHRARSSCSWRVRIGLALAGLAFEPRPAPPSEVVPTLEIDGLRLRQSLAILLYLDETRGLGWLPEAAADRARIRSLALTVVADIQPPCNTWVARRAAELGIAEDAWRAPYLQRGLATCEALLDDARTGRFAHGDRVGLADICLVPQLLNARDAGTDMTPYPRLRALEANALELAAFAETHPEHVT